MISTKTAIRCWLAEGLLRIGLIERRLGRSDVGEQQARLARELAEQALSETNRSAPALVTAAKIDGVLAMIVGDDRRVEAESLFRSAKSALEAAVRERTNDVDSRYHMAVTMYHFGQFLDRLGRVDEARDAFESAVRQTDWIERNAGN